MSYVVSDKARADLNRLLEHPQVQKALAFIDEDQDNTLTQHIRLTGIEAPTFQEQQRAEAYADMLRQLGLEDVHIDRGGNVIGLRRGTVPGPALLVEAHLDTVFPMGSVKNVDMKDGYLFAPGICDDTRGLINILGVIRALNAAGIATSRDIIFMGTTREEGAGSMGGMKDFLADHPGGIARCISIDSASLNSIIYCATGLRTVEFIFHGIGGHAYAAFGQVAQPVHAAARAAAKIAAMEVPSDPRTTFAVSNFHAGNMSGMHAIPAEARIVVNYRSNDPAELEKLHERIFRIVQESCDEETARWGKDVVTWDYATHCDVPAGHQDAHAPMVDSLCAILRHMDLEPVLLPGGATNCNITIAQGIPSVCMGTNYFPTGKEVPTMDHTLAERFPIEGAYKAVQAAFLMTVLWAGLSE